MVVQITDAYRAQYFWGSIQDHLSSLLLNGKAVDALEIDLSPLVEALILELDQLLLPTLVEEIRRAGTERRLHGQTAEERYQSFFIKGNEWTDICWLLPQSFPYLFFLGDSLIQQNFKALQVCFDRLTMDWAELSSDQTFRIKGKLATVRLASDADPHQQGRLFVLSFDGGGTILYKPRDLVPDVLVQQMAKKLDLSPPCDLRFAQVRAKDGYGWIEWIDHSPCVTRDELERYFIRCGSLLALADALNCSDGHYDNLIAAGEYPVLVDLETAFQNYSAEGGVSKSLNTTYLVQKREDYDEEESLFAAFQTSAEERLVDLLTPYAIDDKTDQVKVRYRGLARKMRHNSPLLNGKAYTAEHFVGAVQYGFSYTYRRITERVPLILSDLAWWSQLGTASCRVVLRGTFAYQYLMRMIQRPEHCVSRGAARDYLMTKLAGSPYESYEIEDLLAGNIPYFWHHPNGKDLYDPMGGCYPHTFRHSGLEELQQQLLSRSEQTHKRACEELCDQLQGAKV